MNQNLGVGPTLKFIWKDFTVPDKLFIDFNDNIGVFTGSTIREMHSDVDISATYKITNSFQLGGNLMNLAGTELNADAFIPSQANIPLQQQRSLGLGKLYKWQRLNVGADMLLPGKGCMMRPLALTMCRLTIS